MMPVVRIFARNRFGHLTGNGLVPPSPRVAREHLEDVAPGILCPVYREVEGTGNRDMDADFYHPLYSCVI